MLAESESTFAEHFAHLIAPHLPPDVRVLLWDGREISQDGEAAACTVEFRSAMAARGLLHARNDRHLAELYLGGVLNIEGDISRLFHWDHQRREQTIWSHLPRLGSGAFRRRSQEQLPKPFSRSRHKGDERIAATIAFHYDKPVQFWKLWLDPLLQYTCAYFMTMGDSLAVAQRNKLELICRKLELSEADRLIDIGCGWGGLLEYVLETRYARCAGVTLSRTQLEYASQHLAPHIGQSRCSLAYQDCRELAPADFQKATAIGVLEHMGPRYAPHYFRSAHCQLVPGGLFLSQAICWAGEKYASRNNRFLDAYVFPSGRLLTIGETAVHAEEAGFEVLDIENMSSHYVETLSRWRNSLEDMHHDIVALVGEATYRVFRLYLAGAEHRFRIGRIGVSQMLLRKKCSRVARLSWRQCVLRDL